MLREKSHLAKWALAYFKMSNVLHLEIFHYRATIMRFIHPFPSAKSYGAP